MKNTSTAPLGRFDQTILEQLARLDFGGGIPLSTLRAGLEISDEAFHAGIRSMLDRGLVLVSCRRPDAPEMTSIIAGRVS